MSAPGTEHVRWLADPVLRRPTVVAAFTGWNDAGDAASNAIRHLVEQWGAAPLAEIDPEEFTDFATVRPHVRLVDGVTRTIVWPTVGVWSASTPGGDVVLVLGPEPALRWRRFSEQIVGIARRYESAMVLTLGALLADVPHTRPVQIIGTATDTDVIDRFDLQRSRYEGPTGIVGVLHDACGRFGLSSASLWGAVPAYAAQVPSPKATRALIERACSMLGTPAPDGRLGLDAYEYEARVSAMVNDDDELVGYVRRLESAADDGDHFGGFDLDDDDEDDDDETVGGEYAADDGALDGDLDGDELMAEVEQFLREQPDN
jgi:proteasome assembly chaperone (PAC2) family protein